MNRAASETGSKHTRVVAKDKRTESNADDAVLVGRVGGCVKPRINGEQWSPLSAITGTDDDSERRVSV